MVRDDEKPHEGAGEAARIRAMLARARAGDDSVLPELRAALDDCPAVWQAYGDLLPAAVRTASVELIAGGDLALRESLSRVVEALEAEVAGPSPTPLERLLAARVAATWLQLHHADAAAAHASGGTARQVGFTNRRQDSAQRRHLAAIGALATVRRLLPGAAAGTTALPAAVAGPRSAALPSGCDPTAARNRSGLASVSGPMRGLRRPTGARSFRSPRVE